MTGADRLAIAAAVALVGWLYLHFWGNGSGGELVAIRVAGGESVVLPLDHDRRLTLEGRLGPTVIEIENRQVRFLEAPCEEKRCLMAGWLAHDGDSAACMPNGVTIEILGRDERFDALNF